MIHWYDLRSNLVLLPQESQEATGSKYWLLTFDRDKISKTKTRKGKEQLIQEYIENKDKIYKNKRNLNEALKQCKKYGLLEQSGRNAPWKLSKKYSSYSLRIVQIDLLKESPIDRAILQGNVSLYGLPIRYLGNNELSELKTTLSEISDISDRIIELHSVAIKNRFKEIIGFIEKIISKKDLMESKIKPDSKTIGYILLFKRALRLIERMPKKLNLMELAEKELLEIGYTDEDIERLNNILENPFNMFPEYVITEDQERLSRKIDEFEKEIRHPSLAVIVPGSEIARNTINRSED